MSVQYWLMELGGIFQPFILKKIPNSLHPLKPQSSSFVLIHGTFPFSCDPREKEEENVCVIMQ